MFRQSPISVILKPPQAAEGSRFYGILRPDPRSGLRMTVVFVLTLFLLFPGRVYAKRMLPSAAGGKPAAKSAGGVAAKVKFRSDRKAVILNLSNLGAAKSVSYELQYETNGLMQGAGGSVTIAGDSESREILFGSCSAGVCNYDKNIKNAKLTVTTTLKTGKKIIKPFRLKV